MPKKLLIVFLLFIPALIRAQGCDNYGTVTGSWLVDRSGTDTQYQCAQKITADCSMTVTQVVLRLSRSATTEQNVQMSCSIYTDSGGSPGVLVGTGSAFASENLLVSVPQDFLFSGLNAPVVSGSNYWIVITFTDYLNVISLNWYYVADSNGVAKGQSSISGGWNSEGSGFTGEYKFNPYTSTGTNYFVDYICGSDSNTGLDTNSPWQHCPGDPAANGNPSTTFLNPGDTVFFKGGSVYSLTSYSGIVPQWFGSSPAAPITYDGNSSGNWGTGQALITDNHANPGLAGFYMPIASSNLTFKNFCIYDMGGASTLPADPNGTNYLPSGIAPNAGYGIYCNDHLYNVVISGCTFSNLGYYGWSYPLGNASLGGYGIRCQGCDGVLVSNCYVGYTRDGFYFDVPSDFTANLTVTGCTFSYIEEWACTMLKASTNAYLSNVFICGNMFSNTDQSFDSNLGWHGYGSAPHRDGVMSFGPEEYSGSVSAARGVNDTNFWIYNNLFINTSNNAGGSAWIWVLDDATCYIFNNIFVNNQTANAAINVGELSQAPNGNVGWQIWNNTFYGNNYAKCVALSPGAYGWPTNAHNYFDIRNNIMFNYAVDGYSSGYLNYFSSTTSDFTNYFTFDYDTYYSLSSFGAINAWNDGGTTVAQYTMGDMQTIGDDTHSQYSSTVPFIDPAVYNFQLSSNATAQIGNGQNLYTASIPPLNYDYAGVPRPTCGAWDIGAYQYTVPSFLVNLQMRSSAGAVMTGTEAIGYSSSDYWNQAVGDGGYDGTPINCLDNNGNPVLASITVDGIDNAVPEYLSSSDPLFESCALNEGGGNVQVSVSLPAGVYDFYLYGEYRYISGPTQWPTFQIVSGISGVTDYSPYSVCTCDAGSTVSFTNISVDACTPIVFNVEPGTAVTPMSGMQIYRH